MKEKWRIRIAWMIVGAAGLMVATVIVMLTIETRGVFGLTVGGLAALIWAGITVLEGGDDVI